MGLFVGIGGAVGFATASEMDVAVKSKPDDEARIIEITSTALAGAAQSSWHLDATKSFIFISF
jgi:hypothetical protein